MTVFVRALDGFLADLFQDFVSVFSLPELRHMAVPLAPERPSLLVEKDSVSGSFRREVTEALTNHVSGKARPFAHCDRLSEFFWFLHLKFRDKRGL